MYTYKLVEIYSKAVNFIQTDANNVQFLEILEEVAELPDYTFDDIEEVTKAKGFQYKEIKEDVTFKW